jgi:hypothetical protein
MFGWLKTWLREWARRVQQKEMDRLLEETRRLKAQGLETNRGEPIRLTQEERQRLDALRARMEPEILKDIDLLADAE